MECPGVRAQDEALQQPRTQHNPLQAVEAESLHPPERRRPVAGSRRCRAKLRQPVPGNAGVRVMLDVIAVVEQERVVQRAVMAGRAAGMLVVAVQRAQRETAEVPRQVSCHEERR
jgi:hypothetical protein